VAFNAWRVILSLAKHANRNTCYGVDFIERGGLTILSLRNQVWSVGGFDSPVVGYRFLESLEDEAFSLLQVISCRSQMFLSNVWCRLKRWRMLELSWKRFIFRLTANIAELEADQLCPLGCGPERAEP
jgi:hypothetical protein